MTDSEKELMKAYFVNKELRLQYEVDFWADELRRFPFPTVAASYSAALSAHLSFLEFRDSIESLLDL